MTDAPAFWGSVLCFLAILLVGCAAEVREKFRDRTPGDTAEARRLEASNHRPEVKP